MRCLALSDLHYGLPQFDWLLAEAPHFDLIIIAGDLLELSASVDRRAQIVVVRKYLEKLNKLTRVVVCSGNHDLTGTASSGEQFADWLEDLSDDGMIADGQSYRADNALITACPWWDGPHAQAAIGEQLAQDAKKGARPWIWAYHAPPEESPVAWSGARFFGDGALSRWIAEYSPDVVLAGHVHEAPFVPGGGWATRIGSTWVFNAGRQLGNLPSHIIFDLQAERAAWFSFEGAEELSLANSAPPRPLKGLPDWLPASMGGP